MLWVEKSVPYPLIVVVLEIKMKKTNKTIFLFGIIFFALLFAAPAQAQTLPPGRAITIDEITDIIILIVNTLLGIGGVVAVGFIAWAGITWMAAGGDSKRPDEAKARLKAGLWGAAIVLGVFAITSTIENVVTRQFFNSGSYQGGTGGSGAPCTSGSQCRSGSCVPKPNGLGRWCL